MSENAFDDDITIEGDNESCSDFVSDHELLSGNTSEDNKSVCGDETPLNGGNNHLTEELVSLLQSDFNEDYTIDLNISNDSGIDMSISIKSSSTVEDVIKTVDSEYYDDYDMEYEGRVLTRNMTLREAYIPKKGQAKIIEKKNTIVIKESRNGRKFPIDIPRSASVKDLKYKMRETYMLDYENPRLIFGNNELNDSCSLRQYKIQNNSSLLVANRCNGG
ncbi:unnamed protein product [Chironomus riparius]|uniref:Ubiquitin-like domain-containing protein n=1 Tax=Chironomus riparius TaxID=315576 RepID=A0A9N9S097_9DIPT|nr:unnamed protein product [Chironomus riparius]